ncbi:restriction endonuclease [Ramlibacter terrae]|uniref:Restriction endonuclease n=1 Tax=Ramlibacter terrae TaxID=2732511 RepID=A0ABX6P6K4_9BURK|nr:restriction endonuclease [Ramlibacter terrae]
MARRRRQGAADDLVEGVGRLPWWMGVAVAVATYLLFHWLATRPVPALTDPTKIGNALVPMLVSQFSFWLQYVVPLLCLIGAAVSAVSSRRRSALAAKLTSSSTAQALEDMSRQEFESLVGQAFRLQGYEVREQGGPQADGGVDLVLHKGKETFPVQCKQWKAFKVGVDVVRELYGVMAADGAAGGFVVTSGSFTDDAIAFASGRNVRLVDGPKLFGLLQQAKAAREKRPRDLPAARHPPSPAMVDTARVPAAAAVPGCPKCGSPMVRRTATKGTNAGSQFWGCSKFPACRGTR